MSTSKRKPIDSDDDSNCDDASVNQLHDEKEDSEVSKER
jgi:hypothetical protein